MNTVDSRVDHNEGISSNNNTIGLSWVFAHSLCVLRTSQDLPHISTGVVASTVPAGGAQHVTCSAS